MTQNERLLDALTRAGTRGATSWELTVPNRIMNLTGRISDLRKQGHQVECWRQADSESGAQVFRYRLIPHQPIVGQQVLV